MKLTQKKDETSRPKVRFTATLSGEVAWSAGTWLDSDGKPIRNADGLGKLIEEYAAENWNGNLINAFSDLLYRYSTDMEIDIEDVE